MTGAEATRIVPMLPLGTVLFPRAPVAVRLFEERYLVLLGRLLDEDDPEFGIVLIERGHEVGGGDARFARGTIARLQRVVLQEGPIPVIASGTTRFEVEEWLDDDPYPRARVRLIDDLEWNDALEPMLAEAEAIVRRVRGRAAAHGEPRGDSDVELTDDPLGRAWQLAAIAPLGPLDQLDLLKAATTGGLLRQTIDLTLAAEDLLR